MTGKLHVWPFSISERFNAEFHGLKILGEGAFGTVLLCEHKVDKEAYAVKYTPISLLGYELPLVEVELITRLSHPNIVRYNTSWMEKVDHRKCLYIQMEFCCGGSLRKAIQNSVFVGKTEELAVFLRGIASGLDYIHAQNLIHRDVKPVGYTKFLKLQENILLSNDGTPKLGDFGLVASAAATRHTYGMGTAIYMAPEAVCSNYTNKIDMYNFGVTFYECVLSLSVINDQAQHELTFLFTKDRANFPPEFDKGVDQRVSVAAKNYITAMLSINSDNRPSAAELLADGVFPFAPDLCTLRQQCLSKARVAAAAKRPEECLRSWLTLLENGISLTRTECEELLKYASSLKEDLTADLLRLFKPLINLVFKEPELPLEKIVDVHALALQTAKDFAYFFPSSATPDDAAEDCFAKAWAAFQRFSAAHAYRMEGISSCAAALKEERRIEEIEKVLKEATTSRNDIYSMCTELRDEHFKVAREIERSIEFAKKGLQFDSLVSAMSVADATENFTGKARLWLEAFKSNLVKPNYVYPNSTQTYDEIIFNVCQPLEMYVSSKTVNERSDEERIQYAQAAIALLDKLLEFGGSSHFLKLGGYAQLFRVRWQHDEDLRKLQAGFKTVGEQCTHYKRMLVQTIKNDEHFACPKDLILRFYPMDDAVRLAEEIEELKKLKEEKGMPPLIGVLQGKLNELTGIKEAKSSTNKTTEAKEAKPTSSETKKPKRWPERHFDLEWVMNQADYAAASTAFSPNPHQSPYKGIADLLRLAIYTMSFLIPRENRIREPEDEDPE